ncbi:MAG: class I SAM-dependent methyltransferase [Betaproteobacteria bacterium]|nr:class I SAM-dependent methyltransferase [Betaproteobacteria bacterium]
MKFLRTLACGAVALCASLAHAADVERTGGPYVPTPPAVVEKMLELAGVGSQDFVVDLGSGDGRIVLAAATRYQASGMGVDIDPELVEVANALARKQGIAGRVRFLRQDVMAADLSRATVLTLYLLPGMMASLRPKLLAELKPGTRVVSHDFGFDQWKPDRSVTVETQEKYDMTGMWTSDVHLWIVPAAVQGAWRVTRAGEEGEPSRLEIRQGFQQFEGRFSRGGRTFTFRDGRLEGVRLSFAVPAGNGRSERYSATVGRDRMNGEVRDGEAVVARWSATRIP